jgi:hypothetical protein
MKIRINASDSPDIAEGLYYAGKSPVFMLPPEMLLLQGAHKFGPEHHFVAALSRGRSTLEQFYAGFAPKNLAQMYRLAETGLEGEGLEPWEIPWLKRKREPPLPEAGLGAEHGVSYYGPCTPEKVDSEMNRLTSLVDSINSVGYRPDEHGHIKGQFLRSGNDFRFFVRGGKHRTAALVHLGHKRIPVAIREGWPRVIVQGTEREWPLVREGEVDAGLAAAIFSRYFD